ncbi:hypothetical protein M2475_002044 [Breznakia sp. PF5-3]|nr:hypothetical protein [Breznakia sp. PM6-1]MDF9836463.1 hypothetical protein [Breznakia sp. PF5-3]MDF9838624.1 hypothetical protein [Breznakia sp. PFB2-8]MDF9860655.1 hypothetical protein [Breznakia sp. PH5-24]
MLFFHFLKYFVVKSSFKKGTFSNKELSLQIDLQPIKNIISFDFLLLSINLCYIKGSRNYPESSR